MEVFKILTEFHIAEVLRAIFILGLGFFVGRLISAGTARIFKNHLNPSRMRLLRRILFYSIFILFITSATQQLGFDMSALLGATGLVTVALGIASQNLMSNIVSSLFIMGEKSFKIGDIIKINDLQGEILSIDFLSVKIRSGTDNAMIRIPNEIFIKSPVTNFSYQ